MFSVLLKVEAGEGGDTEVLLVYILRCAFDFCLVFTVFILHTTSVDPPSTIYCLSCS